jgi:hypothetical protein
MITSTKQSNIRSAQQKDHFIACYFSLQRYTYYESEKARAY